MKKLFIGFGKVLVCLVLAVILISIHAVTIQSYSIGGNLFFVVLFSWGISRILWGKNKERQLKRKRFKINPKTWKNDFSVILSEEGFDDAQAKKAIKFADIFIGFECKRFEIAQSLGFKGKIEEYDSGWEKFFSSIVDVGIIALEMRPKTLGYLASLRQNLQKNIANENQINILSTNE